jgi:hypothetical protein
MPNFLTRILPQIPETFRPAGARIRPKKAYIGQGFAILRPKKAYIWTRIFEIFVLKKLMLRTSLGGSFTGPGFWKQNCDSLSQPFHNKILIHLGKVPDTIWNLIPGLNSDLER